MLHSLFLLAFVLLAAPLASFIPLAALAGVLAVVAWNMVERNAVATLLRSRGGDAAVLLVTFLLTIFVGLTEAIVVGFALGSVLFIHRMSQTTAIAAHLPFAEEADRADGRRGERRPYDESLAADPNVVVYRITGAFFFGAAAAVGAVLDRISARHRALIIDSRRRTVSRRDGREHARRARAQSSKRRVRVVLTGTSHEVRQELFVHGVKPPLVRYERSIDSALAKLRKGGLLGATAKRRSAKGEAGDPAERGQRGPLNSSRRTSPKCVRCESMRSHHA